MKNSNTSERLKELMSHRNLKQVDILNLIKQNGDYISKSALSQYVNGVTEPDQRKLTILSEALGVSETWLMGYDVPFSNDRDIFRVNNIIPIKHSSKKIPLIGTIAAGPPILADENIEEYIDLDKKIQADFCLRIKGDSMVDANIYENDIVFIRRQNDVDDGEIAAVLIDDEATLKRVYKIEGKVILKAENPKYKPMILNGDKKVMILGKATYKISEII